MSDLLTQASEQFTRCCIEAPRYRVGWLLGPPQRSRKTLLAQQLCEHNGWHYLDYTGTPSYFDALADCIDAYQPTQFVTAIRGWSQACTAPVLVLDEIDALLATWERTQRYNWAGLVARLQYLPCGLILVSHFFTLKQLQPYLPDGDARYCRELPGD